jgi:hypothetical protein
VEQDGQAPSPSLSEAIELYSDFTSHLLAHSSYPVDISTNQTGVARFLAIIWADVAANAMVCTRGWSSGSGINTKGDHSDKISQQQNKSRNQKSVSVPVRLYEKKIRFHGIYGIEAFMTLV